MSQDVFIFEVSEQSFARYVIENSHKLPVLVEFMGVWSEPCITMVDLLSDLAQEFAGQFVFAKVDVNEQQSLAEQYDIKNIPALLVIQQGEVEFTQEGQMQEDELRILLRGLGVFRESDELRAQARSLHMDGNTQEAIMRLTQAIQQDPGNTRVAMDMVQIFIDMGELEQATGLFNKLPDHDKLSAMGKSLTGQLTFASLAAKTEGIDSLTAQLAQNADDHDARFDLAMCLVGKHDYNAAVEHLFILLQSAADYKEGAAKEMIITISNMLAPNQPEQAQNYRRRLSNLISQ